MDECCTKITTSSSSNHSMVSLQALGGLGAGIIALRYPGILYWGFTNVDEILRMGKSASAPGIWLLTQLVGAKVVVTALCRGSGLVGALYAPSLMIGAALGAVFGGSAAEIINSAIPGNVAVAQPQAYALVGIAATLASLCSVPLTSVLLLFELTKDYRILLALMARLQVPETVVQQIFLLNSLDVELYKHAQEDIFAQQQKHLAEKLDKVEDRFFNDLPTTLHKSKCRNAHFWRFVSLSHI
ncbi:chloride channel protein CLC-f-like isoform X1 [Magnolia sinica]|uniref:chloride channel protein CLC-f-like isoform X1 n=2 Tax=Magnolia sinica TaxID=86752 RepID=UPI002658FEF3|nr:chloride channel protein CLC-f-like isoform X1 [Magnolia sinica]